MSTEVPRPRNRRPPSWEIHDATGVRVPGGTAPDWWTTSAPGYVAPEPTTASTEPVAIDSGGRA
jgi:hypothetical protein